MWNFVFLCQKTDHGCVFIVFFFSRGHRIDQVVLECCKRAHSDGMKSSSALFKIPKIGGHLGPLPRSFFSQSSTDQNFEIAILFPIVENHNNYVFGDYFHPPQFLGEGLQVTNFDHCLHIVMVMNE